MREVYRVKVLKDYDVLLTFDDGISKVVNIKPFIKGPMFQPLHDRKYFEEVIVDSDAGTIVWPNDADLDPDVLYKNGKTVKRSRKNPGKSVTSQKIYHQQTPTNIWSPK